MTFDPESVQYRGATRDKCFELFSRLGFRSLVMEYAPTAETVGKQYSVVATTDALDALVARLRKAGRFGFRVMPDGPTAMRAGIAGVVVLDIDAHGRLRARSPSGPSGGGLFGDVGEADRPGLDLKALLTAVEPLLEDPAILKVGHDLKFDTIVLARHGDHAAGPRDRHDDRELPARRDPVGDIRSRSSRSSTPATRRCARRTSAAAA